MSDSSVHLLVLIHGLWGNPSHLEELARIARETHAKPSSDGIQLRVLVTTSNSNSCTYDGIDWGGERLTEEVLEEAEKIKGEGLVLKKFSITGYSLGGLLARYVIGILHQRRFFEAVEPANFNTIATPHLGLPCWDGSFFAHGSRYLGPILLARTGEQFYGVDKYTTKGRPLLEVMADPDLIFYQALCLFQNKTIYANAVHDSTVPYLTAAMETSDPFVDRLTTGLEIQRNEKYPGIVESWTLPESPPEKPRKPEETRPRLPPFLQFRFPFNFVFYSFLPILIPLGVLIALTKFGVEGSSSRARIRKFQKQLLKDASNSEKLIAVLARMEQDVERTVNNLVNDRTGLAPFLESTGISTSSSTSSSGTSTPSDLDLEGREIQKTMPCRKDRKGKKAKPTLSPLQRRIAEMLNTVPGLKKQLAYFPSALNSHGMIISRDVKRFASHAEGESVIRHWADHMII